MKKFPERTFDTNLTYKEIIKKTHEIVQDRILCQCGHSILIPPQSYIPIIGAPTLIAFF